MEFDDLSNRVIGCAIEVLVENQLILQLESVEEIKRNSRSPTVDLHEIVACKDRIADHFNVTKLKEGIKRFVL